MSILLLFCSIHSYLNYGKDPKHCDGNYIKPSYSTSNFSSSRTDLNKRYQIKRHHENGRKKLGTPVLFLPGNAGNYKQIRSLGSVAARIWIHEFPNLHPLDLYAIETNEELSAFNPNLLKDQAFFANEAVQYILKIYKERKEPPEHVHIIGHSMGGIVAKYMPLMENYKKETIKNIFTLSTPHKEAPVPVSRSLHSFYNTLNNFWKENHGRNGLLSSVTLVSVAGGTRDTTLDSYLTYLDEISYGEYTVSVFSSSVPGIWSSADHEGAVWCDQTLQAISKTIFQIEQLGPENSKETIHRIWEILKNFKGGKIINSTIERINSNNVLLQLTEPNLTIPSLETGHNEIRIHHFALPPLEIRNLYKFRLITNVKGVEVFSCEGDENILHHKCINLSQDLLDLPVPAAALNFTIHFRRESSPPSENRKQWAGFDLTLNDRMANHQFLLIKVSPSSKGFLFADMTKPKKSVYEFSSMLVSLPIFPYKHSIKPRSALTVIRLPRIKDGLLKYKIWIKPFGVLKPSFPPLILQEIMNEKKPISPDGSVVSIYAPRYGRSNNGLIFHIWCDPDIEGFDFYFAIDYWGSLAILSGRYRNLVISLLFALTCICFTVPGRYDEIEHLLFRKVYQSAYLPLASVVSIIAYFFTYSFPDMEYVIGGHDVIMIWYFSAISLFCLGLLQGVYYALKLIVTLFGIAFGRYISPFSNKRFRGAVCLACFVFLLFIPTCIISSFIFIYSFFITAARTRSQSISRAASTHQILCLLLQLFSVTFQIPHLLQYITFWKQGISTSPIPFDRMIGLSNIIFCFFVQPLGVAPSRNMTLISWSMAITMMVFGWKHAYMIPEINSIMMLFASFCAVVESNSSLESETSLSNNKID